MGPYCKFCDNRCFVYTNKGLKATCKEGKFFELKKALLKKHGTNKKSLQENPVKA